MTFGRAGSTPAFGTNYNVILEVCCLGIRARHFGCSGVIKVFVVDA